MNAYAMYDRADEARWVAQQLRDERDAWIDRRAQELIAMFPADPMHMCSLLLPQEAQFALLSDQATEAYNQYISDIAYARAAQEWGSTAPCPF